MVITPKYIRDQERLLPRPSIRLVSPFLIRYISVSSDVVVIQAVSAAHTTAELEQLASALKKAAHTI